MRRQGAGCFVTGRTSELARSVKRRALRSLVDRLVTEAAHLGIEGDEVVAELDRALKTLAPSKSAAEERR